MGQVFRVTFTGTMFSTVVFQNVCHFEEFGGPMTDAQVGLELQSNWCAMLAAGMVNTAGWRNIKIHRVGTLFAATNFPIVVNGSDGVGNLEVQPAVAIKFRLHTLTGGKTGRGRIYLCGYRNQLFTSGQLNGTGITNMNIRLAAIRDRYIMSGARALTLGVMPRLEIPGLFKPCTEISLAQIPGCQRRRNLGIGI